MESKNLRKDMTKVQLLALSFSAMFGSGWLFAPLYAAQIAGPAALLAWAIAGLMSLMIGLVMAEVVALFPSSGGLSSIAKRTHGDGLSIYVTVLNLIVFILLPALEVRAVLQYLSSYIDGLMVGDQMSGLGYFVSFSLLASITLVNLYGVKTIGYLTDIVAVFKVATPILICITFLYAIANHEGLDHARLFTGSPSLSAIPWTQVFQSIAMSGIIFSYNGFNQATLFAGEAKDPAKAIPFALVGSILITGLLYILVQYVFIMAIPEAFLSEGWAKLSFPGDKGPFVGMATLLGLGWIISLIYIDAVVSPLGTGFTYASAAPRLLHSLGESLPALSPILKLNRFGISHFAVFSVLLAECLSFVFLPDLKAMISLLVADFVLCYTIAPASLLTLRRTMPQLPRIFKLKYAKITSYLAFLCSDLMVFSCGWIALRNLMVLTFSFIVIYLLLRGRERFQTLARGSFWFVFQLSSLSILAYIHYEQALSFSTILVTLAGISAVSLFVASRSPKL
ncbi:MAG: APC family permease [Oligoflexales bacterium]|nr:APC family permease [Oligoflexales bacterium]